MTKSLSLLAALSLLACSCAQDDDRSASGRTRSLASVGSGAQALDLRLVVRRSRDAGGQERVTLRVAGPASELPAGVQLPDGQVVSLATSAADATLATAELTALPGSGIYRFLDAGGDALTTFASLSGDPPPYPELVSPLDQGLFLPGLDAVRWTWSGSAGFFDLELSDQEGRRLLLREDLAGREATLEDAPSGPASLELRATSGPALERARWESASRVMIVVGAK